MLLKNLIKNTPENKKRLIIHGLTTNSKKVKKGYIFFAIKGYKLNGEKFIDEAVRNGAAVVVCSKKCKYINKKILIKKTSDIRNFLSYTCSKYFKLKPKNIIAVTGTNGKTSVADLFYQILDLNNIPVASIGTLGIKYKDKIINSNLTSPDTISLHQTLETLKKNKIENVIIEASSHGLDQKRLNNINFKAGIFTNFSQDHLDYHKSMHRYFKAKLCLFNKILLTKKTIISDEGSNVYSGLKKISKKRNLNIRNISLIEKKLHNQLSKKFNEFQIKNLAMAILAAKICKVKEKKIFSSLKKIKSVNGRLELVRTFPNNIKVYVDFAHTPDALNKSIKSLKGEENKNISLVFGCGGDRDFKKRPLMAKIASSNCYRIYVTDDNPRNEKPEKIRNEIIKNIKNINCFNIGSRKKAIELAIKNAESNEIILIAGKGHEQYQIFKNKILKVSDKKIVRTLKLKIRKLTNKEKIFSQNNQILKKIIKSKKIINFNGISIDSRTIKKDNLFLTIKGKKNDGTDFINDALKKGAKYIVSSKLKKKYKKKTILVKDEINFLNHFASIKRDLTTAKIFAITGSAGKTSLKNLIRELMQNFGETFSSPKSYNNHYGVPLSLSQLNLNHKYGVFEIGMSKAGEINNLTKLVRPHIGIITNIAEAHIENFKNLKGIAEAKGELINHIEEKGTIILNRDDKFFFHLAKKAKYKNLRIVSFGINKKSDIYPLSIKKSKKVDILSVKIRKKIIRVEFKNLNIHNILSSLALLSELKIDIKKIVKFYKNYQPSEGRGKIHNIYRYKKKFKLIDESYNANPLSVRNAIMNLNSIKKQKFKKYLLLGDMLELGNKSERLHEDLSKVINNSDIDKVFIKGNKTLTTYKNIDKNKRGNIFQQEEDVDFALNNIIANNDYLMIKGSNATGLNTLSKRMIKGY